MTTPQPQPQQSPTGPRNVDVTQIPGFKKWTIIYTQYLNSELTKEQGRKLSKDKCVKNPSVIEIAEASSLLGFPCVIEPNKGYPKEFFTRGRVRINFEENKFRNPTISNKTILMVKISEMIKTKSPNRPENFNPLSLLPPTQAVSKKNATPQPSTSSTTSTTTTTSSTPAKPAAGKKKKNVNMI